LGRTLELRASALLDTTTERDVDRHDYRTSAHASSREEPRRYPTVAFCEGKATRVSQDGRGRFVVRVGDEQPVGLRLVLATEIVDPFP